MRTVSVKGLSFEPAPIGQPLATWYLSALSLILSFMKSETRTILFLQWVGFKGDPITAAKVFSFVTIPGTISPFQYLSTREFISGK